MSKPDTIYVSHRVTKDGKYYLAGYYYGGSSQQFYDIGKRTKNGDEVIETVRGFRNACRALKQIQLQMEG